MWRSSVPQQRSVRIQVCIAVTRESRCFLEEIRRQILMLNGTRGLPFGSSHCLGAQVYIVRVRVLVTHSAQLLIVLRNAANHLLVHWRSRFWFSVLSEAVYFARWGWIHISSAILYWGKRLAGFDLTPDFLVNQTFVATASERLLRVLLISGVFVRRINVFLFRLFVSASF